MRRFTLPRPTGAQWVLLAALALWLAITLPWVLGDRILVLRDVVYTHRHFKEFGAAELAAGRIPAINPTGGIGQPFPAIRTPCPSTRATSSTSRCRLRPRSTCSCGRAPTSRS